MMFGEKIGSEKCWVNIAVIHKILNPKKSTAGGYSISDIAANIMNIITSHFAVSLGMPATPPPNTPAMRRA
jgi:hypothetical protein